MKFELMKCCISLEEALIEEKKKKILDNSWIRHEYRN